MNPNKTVSASAKGVLISYTDVQKHQWIYYENNNPNAKHIQLKGVSKYQQLEFKNFNKIQQHLYHQTVHGLSVFTEQELAEMSQSKKRRITDAFNKAQIVLNHWKQEIINDSVDSFLKSFFPKSDVIKNFTEVKGTDNKIKNKLSFRDLNITKVMVATKLVETKILPSNFFELSV